MPAAPDLCGCALDDRYELQALIGDGAFGRVYRGLDRRLAREVAVKVIKPWWSEDPDWMRRFEREAQLLARLDDPGIVKIFDVGQAAEGVYYVAELVDGESLASRVAGAPLPHREAYEIATQLCRALAQAHAQNIVHRDVKPGNVLISRRGQVKVGDFGLALLADSSTEGASATIVGTPRYMAPEQAQGLPATPATDVYSVGVVLYEMLAGRPPFSGGSPVELAMRHVQEPPPRLSADIPRQLRSVVERALEKDPSKRYSDGGAMAAALAKIATARPVPSREVPARGCAEASPTLVAPRLTPRANFNLPARRRTRAVFACVLVLLAGMVVAAIATGRGPQVRVPAVTRLTRMLAADRVARAGLRAVFTARYDPAPRGSAISQSPRAGAQLDRGSELHVVLSAGPPPVVLPRVTGESSADARATLQSLGLRVSVAQVPAPGVSPQTVTGQSPHPGASVFPGSTVSLRAAEWPRWRAVVRLAGDGGGQSGPFRILGSQWRVVYSMRYDQTCTWIVFCNGPSATVVQRGGSNRAGFDLQEGSGQSRTFHSGPGTYEINVAPGGDNASWSMVVQDYL